MTFGFLALSCKFVSMRLEDWRLRREWSRFTFTLDTSALVSFKTSSGQTSIKVGFFPFPTLPQGHFFLNTLHWRGPLMAMIDRYWAVSWYVDKPSEEGWDGVSCCGGSQQQWIRHYLFAASFWAGGSHPSLWLFAALPKSCQAQPSSEFVKVFFISRYDFHRNPNFLSLCHAINRWVWLKR